MAARARKWHGNDRALERPCAHAPERPCAWALWPSCARERLARGIVSGEFWPCQSVPRQYLREPPPLLLKLLKSSRSIHFERQLGSFRNLSAL
jgi:hypothetical protein